MSSLGLTLVWTVTDPCLVCHISLYGVSHLHVWCVTSPVWCVTSLVWCITSPVWCVISPVWCVPVSVWHATSTVLCVTVPCRLYSVECVTSPVWCVTFLCLVFEVSFLVCNNFCLVHNVQPDLEYEHSGRQVCLEWYLNTWEFIPLKYYKASHIEHKGGAP